MNRTRIRVEVLALFVCLPISMAFAETGGVVMTAADSLAACDEFHDRCDLTAEAEMARDILEREPGSYEAAWRLSRAFIGFANLEKDRDKSRQRWLEALEYARRAVDLAPDGSQGFTCLAICAGSLSGFVRGREKLEYAEQAREAALRALELDGQNDLACLVLGVWNREIATVGGLAKAAAKVLYGGVPAGASLENSEMYLRRAVALAPDCLNHHRELAITLLAAGRLEEAIAELEITVGLGWKRPADPFYAESALELLEEAREKREDSRRGDW